MLRDPPRVLAWRLLHDDGIAALPALAAFLPRPAAALDRDPIALVLATLATLLAALYLGGALIGRGARFRAGVLGLAALVLVVLPTSAFMAMGYVTGRPYGQDGGVVQLPLAMDKIVAGHSPYDTDYSDTVLAKEAGVSRMWSARPGGPTYGPNPLLHHHAYLPGTHLLMLPFHLAARAAGTTFDPRVLTLAAYFAAALFAARLARGGAAALCAAALVLVNPLVYWHQIFGANDIIFVALILGAMLLIETRPLLAAAVLGVACATKQLAWPFAPFLLVSAAGDWRRAPRAALGRIAGMGAILAGVFAAMVLPIAALDFHGFYVDIFGYNVGLRGVTNYPLGGTPGFGFANFLIYAGAVRSLGDYFPFGVFYVLLIPAVLLLLRAALRQGDRAQAVVLGSAALLLSLYFSRVVHPNYLVALATLLPVAALAGGAVAADAVAVPLLLLSVAVEIAERSPLKLLWDDAVAARFPQFLTGPLRHLLPRCGPELTDDPLSLVWSATAAGMATAYLLAALLGAGPRLRTWLAGLSIVTVVVLPLLVVVGLGDKAIVRAQDEWVAEARGGWAREAVSTSFRGEPARRLEAEHPPVPAGPMLLQRGLRAIGASRDPRMLSLFAMCALVGMVAAVAPLPALLMLLGVLVLQPPAASTIVFGGSAMLGLFGLTLAAMTERPRWRAFALGTAAACSVPATLAGGVLAAAARGRERLRLIVALTIGGLIGWAPLAGNMRGLVVADAGLGVANLWLYFGDVPGPVALGVLWLAGLAIAFLFVRAVAQDELEPIPVAAFVIVLALVVAPSAAVDSVLLPIGLLALASYEGGWSRLPTP